MNLVLKREGMEYGLYLKDEGKKATLNRINADYFASILLGQKFTDAYFKSDRPNDLIIEIGDESVTIIDFNRIKHSPEISPIVPKVNRALAKHMATVKLKGRKIKLYKRRFAMNDIEGLTDDHDAFDQNPILETPREKIEAFEKGTPEERKWAIYYCITYVGLDLGIPKEDRDNIFREYGEQLLKADDLQEKVIRLLLIKKRELDKKEQAIRMKKKNRPTIADGIRRFEWQKHIESEDYNRHR